MAQKQKEKNAGQSLICFSSTPHRNPKTSAFLGTPGNRPKWIPRHLNPIQALKVPVSIAEEPLPPKGRQVEYGGALGIQEEKQGCLREGSGPGQSALPLLGPVILYICSRHPRLLLAIPVSGSVQGTKAMLLLGFCGAKYNTDHTVNAWGLFSDRDQTQIEGMQDCNACTL